MENLHLIVGLGNPGADYARTRHNAGFLVLERLSHRWGVSWNLEKRFNALIAKANCDSGRVLMARPQTFMNASGESVAALIQFYRIELPRMLIVVDDADLALGDLRLRASGSSGGHHGLESIEQHIGSNAYARLRVGIGRKDDHRNIAGHVLGRFSSTEWDLADKILNVAADQAQTWLTAGIQQAMTRYNGSPLSRGAEDERKDQ